MRARPTNRDLGPQSGARCIYTVDGGIPVRARVEVEGLENDGQDDFAFLGDERNDVLVVPQEESALGDLEVRR